MRHFRSPRQTRSQARSAALRRVQDCGLAWREGRTSNDQLAMSMRHALGTGASRLQVEAHAGVTPAQLDGLIGQLELPIRTNFGRTLP